ncbi:unnamed protein product [Malus baccata var. baccata]
MTNKTSKIGQDLLVNILSTLPPKSLMRFKCVAKWWHALINDPRFVDKHLSHSLLDDQSTRVLLKRIDEVLIVEENGGIVCYNFRTKKLKNLPIQTAVRISPRFPPQSYYFPLCKENHLPVVYVKSMVSIVLVVIALCFVTYLGKSNAATPYDIFQFVQQSPIVFCLRSGICGNQPQLYRSICILCAGTLFDRNQMNADHNLQLLLSNSWPNFNIRRTNMDFWAHEYNKHGRCSDNKFSQTQYFHEAYRLWLTYNAQYLFSQTTGIVPGYQYHYIDLESAVQRTIGGKTPLLMCKYDRRIAYLLEVVICFDYNAANPVDCVRTTNCGALVKVLVNVNGTDVAELEARRPTTRSGLPVASMQRAMLLRRSRANKYGFLGGSIQQARQLIWFTYNAQYLFSQTTGIVPGYQYRYIDLESAIQRTIQNKILLIRCKYDGGIVYLLEVVICFDYNAANPVDCVRTTNYGAWHCMYMS